MPRSESPVTANDQKPEPIRGDLGASILGPRNIPLERENPDLLISPDTDAGTVPNLKWPFALSHNRVLSGGWARETTTRELPISTQIAGVNTSDPAAPLVHVAHAGAGADQDAGRLAAHHRLAQLHRLEEDRRRAN